MYYFETADASEINSHIIMEESYELCNLTELTLELKKPLYVTRRINYTCYDVSKNYIVCGATSGSIYLFRRCPVSLLQLIPNLNGPIKLVAISPLEQYICFTTQRGAINVYILNFSTLQPIISSYYLHEMNITQIKWKQNENQIYFGDIKGNVFLVNLNNFLGKNSLNISVHPILFLESPIVQICEYEDLLLVSNFTKCILCNTITEEYKQIGNQPRDGKFGACFHSNEKTQTTRVICARPGSRIWECSIEGNVMKTHKFKNALEKKQATNFGDIPSYGKKKSRIDSMKPGINDQLIDLQIVNDFFVLGRSTEVFYIFDFIHSNIVLWNSDFGSINTIKVCDDTIFIFTNDHKAYALQLKRLDELFFQLFDMEQFAHGIHLFQKNISYFKNKIYTKMFQKYIAILRNKWHDSDSENPLDDFFHRFDEMFFSMNKNEECTILTDNISSQNSNKSHLSVFESVPEKDNQDKKKFTEKYYNDNLTEEFNEKIDTPNTQIQFELKEFAEEQKMLRNLFFIYKSLKISKFNIRERYAELFDNYDLRRIQQLLRALQDMILENEYGTTEFEAKKTCAYIYLNYVKDDCLVSHESESFIIDCLLLVNSQNNATNSTQRCQLCNFPLTVSGTLENLKFMEKVELVVSRLVRRNENHKLFRIIDEIPTVLIILLKIHAAQNCNRSISDIDISDLFFSCVHLQYFLHPIMQNSQLFHTYEFWKCLASRFILLHDEMAIQCIRCRAYSKVNCIDPEYSYDNVFHHCLLFLPPISVLMLLNELANLIPSDAISRKLYVKCLLNVS
ncbi:BLOC-2 complex member HPS5 homolog isoform X2 [Sitodiplosis mosellana]|uniref:BLOC-2 complex member HPS5 homolog isoform X2 n=1 Tax=Sitodiplosis mosellana TaxID=263140 RepID=UPI002444A656|nr:BLOC-2 complex member HPS5 homolog isoform X2 [Sitodiplosis mosellana]